MAASPEHTRFLQLLHSRAAASLDHVTGTLLEHLQGTHDLLDEWGNSPDICLAGLAHAVYGTSGFPVAVLDVTTERGDLVDAIGPRAEALVYFYASCDRAVVYPQIGAGQAVPFRDRFTGEVFVPDDGILSRFMEVTFANELQIALGDVSLTDQITAAYGALFVRSRALVSPAAFACFTRICGAGLLDPA